MGFLNDDRIGRALDDLFEADRRSLVLALVTQKMARSETRFAKGVIREALGVKELRGSDPSNRTRAIPAVQLAGIRCRPC
jgi:hypothetical protein